MSAKLYFHPTLLARRACEIAQSQGGGLVQRDACGRPFVVGVDPLAEPPAEPAAEPNGQEPGRYEVQEEPAWWIRLIRALTAPPPEPGRFHRRRGLR